MTLKVDRMPLNEVLRYVADQAKVSLHYEKHAVVASPLSTAADGSVKVEKSDGFAGN